MRFDFITIFPEYFAPLRLSLLGKASEADKLEIAVHDLRDWASGKHLSVDDTPLGGGAGMVMRPDVWGKAIDAVLTKSVASSSDPSSDSNLSNPRRILAIPTPSGVPLTQRVVEELAQADQIVVACGRYEGIDARVAQHYREAAPTPCEVLEFSLGDYVLGGGEIAGLVLAESIGRLVDGVVGNPESLREESHSELGWLEYPVFTRPREWRGIAVPEVLLGGDHGAIARWRRDQSLYRTAQIRPDLLAKIPLDQLDYQDRDTLAQAGWLLRPVLTSVKYRLAEPKDLLAVADLAARTFPLACPDSVAEADVQAFIAENLNPGELNRIITAEGGRICVAEIGLEAGPETGTFAAYTLMLPEPEEPLPGGHRDAAYLSKCYTDLRFHGSGVSAGIIEYAVADAARAYDCTAIALGTNIGNKRAQKFYRRHGFKKVGRRTFMVGDAQNIDDVFVRNVAEPAE